MCAAPKKTELKREELEDGSIVCWPREYSHLEEPKVPSATATENRQRVVAALKDCQRAVAISEYIGFPDFTGRYEGPESQCCINQAGFYMVVWWSYADPERRKRFWPYGAEFDEDSGIFVLHDLDDPSKKVANLFVVAFGSTLEIRFDWYPSVGGPADVLVRYSERATLSERAVEAIRRQLPAKPHPVVVGYLDNEHLPLGPTKVEWFVRGLTGKEVKQGLQTLFREEVTHDARSWAEIQKAILPITRSLYEIFRSDLPSSMQDPKRGLDFNETRDDALRARVRYVIQEALHEHPLTLEVGEAAETQTATLYEWFQRGLYYNHKGTASPNVRYDDVVRNWLGISAGGEHHYDLEIDLDGLVLEHGLPMSKKIEELVKKHADKLPIGAAKQVSKWIAKHAKASVGVRAFTGTLTIKTRGQIANWEATYWVFFTIVGGGNGSRERGLRSLRATGTTTSDLPWGARHFDGSITVLAGELARNGNGKLADNQLLWVAEGSHPAEPSLQLLFDSIETDLSASDLGIGWGKILDPNTINEAPATPTEPKIFRYSAQHGRGADLHFVLGSATVLEEGRRLVRILAANELSALRERSCLVSFHGFADRLGGVGYNDVLSQMRAENTKTALLDCLTGPVTTHMTVRGHGERALAMLDEVFDFPDQSPSPEWRRVFVLVHGVASIELVVRDLKDVK